MNSCFVFHYFASPTSRRLERNREVSAFIGRQRGGTTYYYYNYYYYYDLG